MSLVKHIIAILFICFSSFTKAHCPLVYDHLGNLLPMPNFVGFTGNSNIGAGNACMQIDQIMIQILPFPSLKFTNSPSAGRNVLNNSCWNKLLFENKNLDEFLNCSNDGKMYTQDVYIWKVVASLLVEKLIKKPAIFYC